MRSLSASVTFLEVCADFIFHLVRVVLGLTSLAVICGSLLTFGLFVFFQLSDAPPFEVVAKKW